MYLCSAPYVMPSYRISIDIDSGGTRLRGACVKTDDERLERI